jgi:hypothetical protein
MIHILESAITYRHAYFFVSPDYVSSNFDFLEQLSDVGLDDPNKVPITLYYINQAHALQDFVKYADVTLLATVDSLDDLFDNYPELFL